MKSTLFVRIFPLCICMMFSTTSFAQLNEPPPEPFSSSSPFEPSEKNENNKNTEDEIFYDSTTLSTPDFFDILSSPQKPFSSSKINNHTGQSVDDPGKDCDAPIDDHITLLFIAAIILRFRFCIKRQILNVFMNFNPIMNYKN